MHPERTFNSLRIDSLSFFFKKNSDFRIVNSDFGTWLKSRIIQHLLVERMFCLEVYISNQKQNFPFLDDLNQAPSSPMTIGILPMV